MNPVLVKGFLYLLDGVVSLANTAISTINRGISALVSYNDNAIKTARTIGMPFQQSIAYTRVLTQDTQQLALAYGVTGQKIAELQTAYAQATGKAMLLSTQQKEHILQVNKLIGEGTTAEIQKAYANMGSFSPDTEQIHKAIAEFSKAGLPLETSSKTFAQNLQMANSYSFANGVEGITKMTALSEKLKFNLQSFSPVIDKFQNFTDAIQASGKLQSLGGLGAAYGANPLTMMYEGINDPEGLVERFTKVFESMAVFDKETGMGKISGQNMQIIKEMASAIGLDSSEAIKIAKNGSRAQALQGQMGSTYDQLTNDQQDFISNKATWNEKAQRFEINVLDERTNQMVTRPIDELTPQEIEQFQKEASMTTTDAVKQASKELVTMGERQEAFWEYIKAVLAEVMFPMLGDMFKLQEQSMKLAIDLAKLMGKTIFNLEWWKSIVWDGIALLLKGVLRVAVWTLEGLIPWLGIPLKILNVLGDISEFMGWGEKSDVMAGLEKLNIMHWSDALVDALIPPTISQAKTEANQAAGVVWEDIKGVGSTLGNMVSKVSDALGDTLSNAGKRFDNQIANIHNGKDISSSNANPSYSSSNVNRITNNSSTSSNRSSVYNSSIGSSLNSSTANSVVSSRPSNYSYSPNDHRSYLTPVNNNTNTYTNTTRSDEDYFNNTGFGSVVNAIHEQTNALISNDASVAQENTAKPASVANNYTDEVYYYSSSNVNKSGDIVSSVIPLADDKNTGKIVKGGELTNGVTPNVSSVHTINNTSTTNNMSGGQLSLGPMSVNVNGTINLAGIGSNLGSIDAKKLFDNPAFLYALRTKVEDFIRNGGANMNVSQPRHGVDATSGPDLRKVLYNA